MQRAQSSSSKRQKPNASAIARHRVRREITCRIKKFDAKLPRSGSQWEYLSNPASLFAQLMSCAPGMRTRYAHQVLYAHQLRVPGRRIHACKCQAAIRLSGELSGHRIAYSHRSSSGRQSELDDQVVPPCPKFPLGGKQPMYLCMYSEEAPRAEKGLSLPLASSSPPVPFQEVL